LTLPYTLTQTRDRAVAAIGTLGVPNAWWPLSDPDTNDCIAAVLYWMGERSRKQLDNHFISIAGFRAWAGWNEVAASDIRPGDIALENWADPHTREVQHAELVYSVVGTQITTISANTSPAPGVDMTVKNRGVAKKTRTTGPWLIAAIRPPYKNTAAATTSTQRAEARLVAAYVNRWRDIDKLPRTATQEDGIPGPIYWTLVQTWGRAHGEYGPTYVIDGIPGPRTYAVEKIIYAKAKAAGK